MTEFQPPKSITLGEYLDHKSLNPNLELIPDEPFVVLRTRLNGTELIGIVDRHRLARLLQATSSAAYHGYTELRDPDKLGKDGKDYFSEKTLGGGGPEIGKALKTVSKKIHQEYGRRPGEIIEPENPKSVSYDHMAAIQALVGDDPIFIKIVEESLVG